METQSRALDLVLEWQRHQDAAPDRVRSFLKHLAGRSEPLRFRGFPGNLYTVSDRLAQSAGELALSCCGNDETWRPVTLRVLVRAAGGVVVRLEFGSLFEGAGSLVAPALLDLLIAGGRILAAPQAQCLAANQLVAAWISAASRYEPAADPLHGEMILVQEQWDGAQLWLRPGPSTLAYSLQMSDWRIRIAAMIAATRLGLTELGPTIRSMELPDASIPGVTNDLRHLLLAMRKAALIVLSGAEVPPAEAVNRETRTGMQAHLLRLMAGKPAAFQDEFARLIDSLLEPPGPQGPRKPNVA